MSYTLTFSLFLTNILIFKQISEKKTIENEILRVQKRHVVFFDRLISLYFFWSTGQTGFYGTIRKISGSEQFKSLSRKALNLSFKSFREIKSNFVSVRQRPLS